MAKKVKPSFDVKRFLSTTHKGRAVASYRAGKVIFAQSEPADSIFYVQKGKCKISVLSKQGKEAVVGILGPGEFLGEGCLIGDLSRVATATAMVDSVLMKVDKHEAVRVLQEEPAFRELLVFHLLTRNTRVQEDLVDQLCNSSEKRLARTLLLLADFGKEGGLQPITRRITQETLAEIVGTTRSRISFFMSKFRRLGFIEYKEHLEVRSSLQSVVTGNDVQPQP